MGGAEGRHPQGSLRSDKTSGLPSQSLGNALVGHPGGIGNRSRANRVLVDLEAHRNDPPARSHHQRVLLRVRCGSQHATHVAVAIGRDKRGARLAHMKKARRISSILIQA